MDKGASMTESQAKKLAERIWKNQERLRYTFSHSLSAGRFKKDTVEKAIKAINSCQKNEQNSWNPTKEQFIEAFILVCKEESGR